MKYLLIILGFIVILVSFGCGDREILSGRDYEIDRYRMLVETYAPFLEGLNGYEKIAAFRNHIHWVAAIGEDPSGVPFLAKYYEETVLGLRTSLCNAMSFNMAAFFEAYGYQFRMICLGTGEINQEGIPIGHSVIEVFIDGHWEMHDTLFNVIFVYDGQSLSVREIQGLVEQGIYPDFSSGGYATRVDLPLDEPGLIYGYPMDCYWEYFKEITYSFTEVF